MATARKSGASACRSSIISAELCWLMWLIMMAGAAAGPQARQWMWPANVLARPRSIGSFILLELHVGELDHLGPLGALAANEGGELVGLVADRDAARGGIGVDHFLAVQGGERGIEDLVACGKRRRTRRDQHIPVVGVDLGQAELAHRRHLGQEVRARVRRDR